MAEQKLNQKHRVVAREYLRTGDKAGAYMKAYPKASRHSAEVKVIDLFKNVNFNNYISQLSEKAEQKSVELAANEIKPIFLSINEKRNFLRQIALGEIEIDLVGFHRGETVPYKRKANFKERLAAIELDSKLSGDLKQATSGDMASDDKLLRVEGDKIIIVQNFNGLI